MSLENYRISFPQISTFKKLKELILDFDQLPLDFQEQVRKETRQILKSPIRPISLPKRP